MAAKIVIVIKITEADSKQQQPSGDTLAWK